MPNEALSINYDSQKIDAALASNVRTFALTLASLDAQQGHDSYALQSDIPNLYKSIHAGFGSEIDKEAAINLYNSNFKNSKYGLVFSYLGLDSKINNLIGSSQGFSEVQAAVLKSAFNAVFSSSSLYKLDYPQISGILDGMISYFNTGYGINKNNLNISPFTRSFCSSILRQNYGLMIKHVDIHSPKNVRTPLYVYSYYDTTPIFSKAINYQLMADAEAQYYYVSGVVNYSDYPFTGEKCRKEIKQNEYGNYEFILNLPCTDEDLTIGPIRGLGFYRKFPDGPNALSDEELKWPFSGFNEAADPGLYKHSSVLFSDPAQKYKLGAINSDLQIFRSINQAEMNVCPDPPQKCKVEAKYDEALLSGTGYSSANVGKEGYRWKVTGEEYDDQGKLFRQHFDYVNITGYRVVPLVLDKTVWGKTYNSLRTNPDVSLDNKLLRALNFGEYLNESGVGGPVVINEFSEIPCLYISESFFNKTLSTKQSGSFYLGTFSNGGGLGFIPSINGQYFTGVFNNKSSYKAGDTGSFPKINFLFEISNTGFSGEKAYHAQRCLGMGGSTGDFSGSGLAAGVNVGIPYNQFTVFSGNEEMSIEDFLSYGYAGVLGKNGGPDISYIDGFTSKLPTKTEKVFGYDQNKDLVTYNYFRPGTYGGIVVPRGDERLDRAMINWTGPWTGDSFPIPSGAESLTPIVKTQKKENYLPRFSKGPYSSSQRVFLYPSASGVNNLYSGAFPKEFEVNLTVTEEIARKIFETREIYVDVYGNFEVRDRTPENPIFNSSKNFASEPPYASESNPVIENQETFSDLTDYVPNYWVANNYSYGEETFINNSYPWGAIKNLFTGLCSVANTGILQTSSFDISDSLLWDFGVRNPGHYVIEYETGHYFGQADNFHYAYRFQEPYNALGIFLIHSSGARLKLNLPPGSAETSTELLEYYSQGITEAHTSFYHAGGKIQISGHFPSDSGPYVTVTPFTLRLEKDCDLCEELYLKYSNPNDIHNAGFKYLPTDQCVHIKVYQEDFNSEFEVKQNEPTFTQGVRGYHGEQWCCKPGNGGCGGYANYVELRKIYVGGGEYDFYYEEMPKYDTHKEFHYQSSRNYNLTIKYTLPSFSLSDKKSHPEYSSESIQTIVPVCPYIDANGDTKFERSGSPTHLIGTSSGHESFLFNRGGEAIKDGHDPIWFETVGGNSSVPGGYHSKGLFGDSWMGFSGDDYGIWLEGDCRYGVWWTRHPEEDNFLNLLDVRPGFNISLHTRALKITPGYYEMGDDFTRYDLTGIERVYSLPISGDYSFDSIINAFQSTGFESYHSYSTDYYYPRPGYFYGINNLDLGDIRHLQYTGWNKAGRAKIIKSSGIFEYWSDVVKRTNDPYFRITGVKYLDKARVNFKINSIKLKNAGAQPFDTDIGVAFTGSCKISGEFGYHSQAESAVFTEGVFLEDHSNSYPYVPKFVSDVLLRIPNNISGTPESPIYPAPSRCLTRQNVPIILQSGNIYTPHLTESPYNYNKFIVPAKSDLSIMNEESEEASLERVLQNDGFVYPNATFLLSASMAQHLKTNYRNVLNIPNSPKIYYVKQAYQFYDSSVTDAVLNSGYFIKNKPGGKNTLSQLRDTGGFIGPEGARYSLASLGIYKRSGEGELL